jgi:hypothetical protein
MPGHQRMNVDEAIERALAEEQSSLGRGARTVEQLIDRLSPKEPHGGT